jgi:poly(A) polymerase
MASEICLRLKLSNDERERVEWLVEKHQFLADVRSMRTSKVKTMLNHPGIHSCWTRIGPTLASGRSTDHVEYCEQLLREWTTADLNPAPLVTGLDLIERGLEPRPQFRNSSTRCARHSSTAR